MLHKPGSPNRDQVTLTNQIQPQPSPPCFPAIFSSGMTLARTPCPRPHDTGCLEACLQQWSACHGSCPIHRHLTPAGKAGHRVGLSRRDSLWRDAWMDWTPSSRHTMANNARLSCWLYPGKTRQFRIGRNHLAPSQLGKMREKHFFNGSQNMR